jgi:putative phosphoesterase
MKLLIVSDLHANWPALEALVAAEPESDGVICLGDLVNYGPHPAPCVEWVQQHALPGWVVQGNHDRALGCDEDPGCSAPYRPLAAAMQRYTAAQLDPRALEYLGHLPPRQEPTIDGARFFLCHAVPTDPLYAYVQAGETERWEHEIVAAHQPDFLLVGHTHRGFIRPLGGTLIVNPGSVGQPKDGDPRAAYAVWHDGEITLRRASYDLQAVARDLAACTSPKVSIPLAGVLLTGGQFHPAEIS